MCDPNGGAEAPDESYRSELESQSIENSIQFFKGAIQGILTRLETIEEELKEFKSFSNGTVYALREAFVSADQCFALIAGMFIYDAKQGDEAAKSALEVCFDRNRKHQKMFPNVIPDVEKLMRTALADRMAKKNKKESEGN